MDGRRRAVKPRRPPETDAMTTASPTTAGPPTADLDLRRRRAAYRSAHRGVKEMDWLLGRYADARLAGMSETELAEFERLIDLPVTVVHAGHDPSFGRDRLRHLANAYIGRRR